MVRIETPGTITGTFDVVYNTAVPEPESIVMAGTAVLMGLGYA